MIGAIKSDAGVQGLPCEDICWQGKRCASIGWQGKPCTPSIFSNLTQFISITFNQSYHDDYGRI